MLKSLQTNALVCTLASCVSTVGAFASAPVIAAWDFENFDGQTVVEQVSQRKSQVHGPVVSVAGVGGKGLKLDGFRSYVMHQDVPSYQFGGGFTVEGWVALAAYPWSWAPLIDCSQDSLFGFFLGVGPDGEAAFRYASGHSFHQLTSAAQIPLRKWTHLAASFTPGGDVSLYINGEAVAREATRGNFVPPKPRRSFTLGRTVQETTWRQRQIHAENTHFFLDGLIDDIVVTSGAKSAEQLRAAVAAAQPPAQAALSNRSTLPTGPEGDGSFGAFYTRLDYYPEWDAMWRVGDVPDVFVRFEDSPVQLVFWRGTSFVPCWVTGNDIWYTNEWMETWGADVAGCAEPIMDRRCQFSHVRIIENTPARVVIHWRYALADTFYTFAAVTDDGRGEWADEYHIIYPDQVGVRRIDLHYSLPERKHDWVEQIIVMPPGRHPDEVVERDAISLLNMKGDVGVYTWSEDLPKEMPRPEGANISHVNLKSPHQPFIVVPDGPVNTVEGKWDAPFFRTFAAGQTMPGFRPDPVPSVYGWWDHWPVAQIPGDGRWVTTPDRPSHFTLTTFVQWQDHHKTSRTRTRVMLQGMIDAEPEALVPLARSWLNAAELEITSGDFKSEGYDTAERAYAISAQNTTGAACKMKIHASTERPLHHPAFIIRNWGQQKASLRLNGASVRDSKAFRQGVRRTAEGHDLIVWLEIKSRTPVEIEIHR